MLLKELVATLKQSSVIPEFDWREDEKELIIAPVAQGFGDVVIEEVFDELRIHVGNFTHWHVARDENDLPEAEQATFVVGVVMDFLERLFQDEIICWNNRFGGGCRSRGSKVPLLQRLMAKHTETWLWSGKIQD